MARLSVHDKTLRLDGVPLRPTGSEDPELHGNEGAWKPTFNLNHGESQDCDVILYDPVHPSQCYIEHTDNYATRAFSGSHTLQIDVSAEMM